jgi:hypothetical protein
LIRGLLNYKFFYKYEVRVSEAKVRQKTLEDEDAGFSDAK